MTLALWFGRSSLPSFSGLRTDGGLDGVRCHRRRPSPDADRRTPRDRRQPGGVVDHTSGTTVRAGDVVHPCLGVHPSSLLHLAL